MTMRETLADLGLSQTGAARLLGVNARTMRGYCEPPEAPGHRGVPLPIWRLLDLIQQVPGVRERLTIGAQRKHPPCQTTKLKIPASKPR